MQQAYLLRRLWLAARLTPARWKRIGQHLLNVCPYRFRWWLSLWYTILDAFFVFDLYEILSNGLALRTRKLSPAEKTLLRSVYGESLPYDLIRVDEYARLGPPQGRFCYVSFHTINSWGPMSDSTLVHEALHIWQYCRVGAVYIPRALAAQRTEAGYNYGGLARLRAFPDFDLYNYEQQADIIADAFCLRVGYPLRWSPEVRPDDLAFFRPFLDHVRQSSLPSAYP